MNILGIDPGTISCGYAILKCENTNSLLNADVIKIKQRELKYQITEFIEAFDIIFSTYDIHSVAIESIFYSKNPKSLIKLAQFRGAILLYLMQKIGNFTEYTPLQVKRSVTGKGNATKDQVSFMVKQILNIKDDIKSFDITDAIAVCLTHCQRLK